MRQRPPACPEVFEALQEFNFAESRPSGGPFLETDLACLSIPLRVKVLATNERERESEVGRQEER